MKHKIKGGGGTTRRARKGARRGRSPRASCTREGTLYLLRAVAPPTNRDGRTAGSQGEAGRNTNDRQGAEMGISRDRAGKERSFPGTTETGAAACRRPRSGGGSGTEGQGTTAPGRGGRSDSFEGQEGFALPGESVRPPRAARSRGVAGCARRKGSAPRSRRGGKGFPPASRIGINRNWLRCLL